MLPSRLEAEPGRMNARALPGKVWAPTWPCVGRVDRTADTLAVDLRVMGKRSRCRVKTEISRKPTRAWLYSRSSVRARGWGKILGACA